MAILDGKELQDGDAILDGEMPHHRCSLVWLNKWPGDMTPFRSPGIGNLERFRRGQESLVFLQFIISDPFA